MCVCVCVCYTMVLIAGDAGGGAAPHASLESSGWVLMWDTEGDSGTWGYKTGTCRHAAQWPTLPNYQSGARLAIHQPGSSRLYQQLTTPTARPSKAPARMAYVRCGSASTCEGRGVGAVC